MLIGVRWDLAGRALATVLPLAAFGLLVLDDPDFAAVASLTALWLLLADFRAPQLTAYLRTSAGLLVAAIIGSAPMPVWLTVLVVAAGSFILGVTRGFGGYAGAASVTVLGGLLVSVALTSVGASASSVVLGTATGALVTSLVGLTARAREQQVDAKARQLAVLYTQILAGERPDSDAVGTSEDLTRSFVASTDRPAAPTRRDMTRLNNFSALARLGDLLALGVGADDPQLRRDCAARLAGGTQPVRAHGDLWQRALAFTVETFVDDTAISRGEWRRQLRVRVHPHAMLFVQAAVMAVLYGFLTGFVILVHPEHGQWILLGAITAGYPYARQATATLRKALLGTLLAFVILVPVIPLIGQRRWEWWLVLATSLVVACGTPRNGRGWIIGQAGSTVVSLTLLAIVTGGLHAEDVAVRVESVLGGGLAAVAVALVLAPRHLRERLQYALAALYDAAADGLLAPKVGIPRCRAHFLRCSDAIESMRGTRYITNDNLAAWLDAARNVVQMVVATDIADQTTDSDLRETVAAASLQCQRRAEALRSNRILPPADLPEPPDRHAADLRESYLMLLQRQREELADLTPMLPRRHFLQPR